MKYKNLLVPFDGSEHAVRALEAAIDLADGVEGVTVHVLRVAEAAGAESGLSDYDGFEVYLNRRVNAAKEAMLAELAQANISTDGLVVAVEPSYSPTEGIICYAEDHNVDLIVMGRRGVGALRGMLGSVSYGILHNVDIPVMTVK
jgi:nucleotide-binding universal stress UspA family protein